MPRYWLMKSEPDCYSISDLERDRTSGWEGVRNYQARNFMRDEMRVGDEILFYHSSAEPPAVAGLARVRRTGLPDPTALDESSEYFDPKASEDDPRWYMVEIEFVERFPRPIPLATLRSTPGLETMPLLNKSRLSVQPVTPEEFEIVRGIAKSEK